MYNSHSIKTIMTKKSGEALGCLAWDAHEDPLKRSYVE